MEHSSSNGYGAWLATLPPIGCPEIVLGGGGRKEERKEAGECGKRGKWWKEGKG